MFMRYQLTLTIKLFILLCNFICFTQRLFLSFQLLGNLVKDFTREGWLWKTGPKPSDSYKKRWFTLDHRKLMYHEDPMVLCYLFILSLLTFFYQQLQNNYIYKFTLN